MKIKFLILIFVGFILSGCVGVSSKGVFGTGVSVALDPRTLGTQIDCLLYTSPSPRDAS